MKRVIDVVGDMLFALSRKIQYMKNRRKKKSYDPFIY